MKLDARIERPNISRFMLPIRALQVHPSAPNAPPCSPFRGPRDTSPTQALCSQPLHRAHSFIHPPSNIYRVLPRVAPRPGHWGYRGAVRGPGLRAVSPPPPPPGSTGAAWPPHARAQSGRNPGALRSSFRARKVAKPDAMADIRTSCMTNDPPLLW
uniref:Uncharacterized protein n=1 Tax=Myotis myotis TaxID=51298 RepID=A0A7J7UPG7_MYOMY|nr:hypothetical protein mMyoMyo1_008601 [Myotis myotis]